MRRFLVLLYFLLCGILLSGLFFHQSFYQQIFIYSYKYFALITGISLTLLIVIPLIIRRLIRKHGTKNILYGTLPSLAVLLIAYIFFHYRYYAVQEHPFDPFLQIGRNDGIEDLDEPDLLILALGGSTTMNQNVDSAYRYPTVLESRFREAFPKKKVKVLNAGMFWYTSKHSLINYHTYYKRAKPDAVIVMHAINDLYRSFTPPQFTIGDYRNDYSHFYASSANGAKPPSFESPLFTLIGKYWFSLYRKSKAVEMSTEQFKSLPDYSRYMRTLIKDVISDSATCYVLEQSSLYKDELSRTEESTLLFASTLCTNGKEHPDIPSMQRAMDQYNGELVNICAQEGVFFVETKNAIQADLDHFIDDVHYTNIGSEKLGNLVFETLINDTVILKKLSDE